MRFKFVEDGEVCPCGTSGKKFKKCCKRSSSPYSFDKVGTALFEQGRHAAATECYRHAISLNPGIPEIYHKLGIVYQAQGNFRAAAKFQRRAVKMRPEVASAHNNLGISLVALGEYQLAAESFQTALSLQPDHERASNHLGGVMVMQGRYQEALVLYRGILAQQPDNSEVCNRIGDLLGKLGQEEEARVYLRQSINLFLAGKVQWKQQETAMPVKMGYEVLLSAKKRLDAAGIPFFLSLGTLLGVIRDGDLLPFDKDLDIGTLWETGRPEVVAALTGDGVFACPRWSSESGSDSAWRLCFHHTTKQISLDVFFYKPDGDYFLAGLDHLPEPIVSRPQKFDIGTIDWQGEAWPVPADCERYLSDYYGSEWRVPDKYFDTVISSKCQVPSTRSARMVYGYTRLHGLLASRRLGKLASICEQVLALDPDDEFIVGLRDLALREEGSAAAGSE